MTREEKTIALSLDTVPLKLGAEEAVKALGEINRAAAKTAGKIEEICALRVTRNGLSKDLLLLRLHFGKLKAAVKDAAAPVAAVLLPVLDDAVLAITRFVRSVGKVLGALLGGAAGTDAVADSASGAAEAEENLAAAAVSAGRAVRRSLAGFDRLERLGDGTGVTGGQEEASLPKLTDSLSPALQGIVEKINALLEPLRRIDFSALLEALANLGQAVQAFGRLVGSTFQWVWFELLTPFLAWVAEELAPVFSDTLAVALRVVTGALGPLTEGFRLLWEKLTPVVEFIGETVILTLEALETQFALVAQTLEEKGMGLREVFALVGQAAEGLWHTVEPILVLFRELWGSTLDFAGQTVNHTVGLICDVLSGLVLFVSGVLSGDWEKAWSGLVKIFKGSVNGIIGLINSLLSGVVGGMNALVRSLNRLHFDIPDWDIFGSMAGKRFGLSLPTMTLPQIPYLAKGAVLPANRPFLAMVGDQRRGTNVEAPLEVIQEAVAAVMEDLMAGNMAGHQATVSTLREILDAVLGIEIGDRVIGQAAERYSHKMAMMKGGVI